MNDDLAPQQLLVPLFSPTVLNLVSVVSMFYLKQGLSVGTNNKSARRQA